MQTGYSQDSSPLIRVMMSPEAGMSVASPFTGWKPQRGGLGGCGLAGVAQLGHLSRFLGSPLCSPRASLSSWGFST